jgi:hypothetical protein
MTDSLRDGALLDAHRQAALDLLLDADDPMLMATGCLLGRWRALQNCIEVDAGGDSMMTRLYELTAWCDALRWVSIGLDLEMQRKAVALSLRMTGMAITLADAMGDDDD